MWPWLAALMTRHESKNMGVRVTATPGTSEGERNQAGVGVCAVYQTRVK